MNTIESTDLPMSLRACVNMVGSGIRLRGETKFQVRDHIRQRYGGGQVVCQRMPECKGEQARVRPRVGARSVSSAVCER